MSGSPQRPSERKAVLDALKTPPLGGDFVWDGKDEDERPLSREEMQAGIAQERKRRGRPVGSNKASTTIRLDRDVLEAFRAMGPGWQTRMNTALREWLRRHKA
ncbi:MAG: BrnA antitoxin family protein [Nitrococcus sp.]|nr:BrnA antitoxin family protein [Nitrococcus sp.]